MSYETRRSPGIALGIGVGYMVGSLTANLIHLATDNTDAHLKGVQVNNEQLYGRLSQGHPVKGLILNDRERTFTFQSTAPDGQAETCAGRYDVRNDIAYVTGDLACTQTVVIAQK